MQPYFRFVYTYFFSLLFLASLSAAAQERCGTVPYMQKLKNRKQMPESDQLFENWLQQKLQLKRSGRARQQQGPPYEVPVVVHVVHDGDALGTGTNISDAQIQSQIDVLNADFNRENADQDDTWSAAGAMDITFVLAKQDPEGLPTSGIVRVRGSKDGWTMNDNYELKSQSNWPSEDYLNIWVCDIVDDLVGYAQLPESSTLDGLENSSNNAFTDGVVIWYKAFGSVDDGAFDLDPAFNKGRTATHEIGHFFGLRHIWGDDGSGCGGDDYVADTPNQSSSTRGCPSHPKTTCSTISMFQNFLDYTDDVCMNLFTEGQVDRMAVVIEESPRRLSLLTSHGLDAVTPVANDLGIRSIQFPLTYACGPALIPRIEVRNYGNNAIASARIELTVDGVTQETKDFAINLDPIELGELTFAPLTLTTGPHEIAFAIQLVNGTSDGNGLNDEKGRSFVVPESITTPFLEEFNTLPSKWTIENPDALATWQLVTAPASTPSNKALRMRFPAYDENFGEFDIVYSPVFDLSSAPVASLYFNVAYAQNSLSNDRLKVVVLKDCEDILTGTTVYDKSGSSLKTVPSTPEFVPQKASDWRNEYVDLTDFIGESHVRLAFIGINDTGNNLYLDDILLSITVFEDVNLNGMINPWPVTCEEEAPLQVRVQNVGNITIQSLKIEYALNDDGVKTINATGLSLERGTDLTLTLDAIRLRPGQNVIQVQVTQPNGNPDQSPANNQREFSIVVNQATDRIPLRQNFESPFDDAWTIINPLGGMTWQSYGTNLGTSLYFDAYDNPESGDQAWVVTPVLDFSNATSASMGFDYSYAHSTRGNDALKVMVSRDCGETYEEYAVLPLGGKSQENEWVPAKESDWQKGSVNLNAFSGKESIRIAFVVTNANGNNLFLDNIEFFTTDAPTPVTITEAYSIYGYNLEDARLNSLQITFNLEQRQDVDYIVVDAMGKQHTSGTLHDVLNQTYPLRLEENLIPGVYIVRLKIGGKYYTNRVIVTQ